MSLTRYQFELLAYLEKTGKSIFNQRTISDSIAISGNVVAKSIEEMLALGYISKEAGCIEITKAGLEALEPYRVKKALILAAGFGERMMPATKDRPKPLVTVCGVRIIDTLLDALIRVGITDITIIRGYRKEVFDELLEKYPFVKLIDNDIYNKTNNISSAILGKDAIDNCYLCESDLYISNPDVITKYQYASNILGSYSLETDDWSFKMNKGYITEYGKGNTYCYNYYGISYWTPEDCKKLNFDFQDVYDNEADGSGYFWEFVPLVLRHSKYQVEIRQCKKEDIIEIDNYYELQILDPSYK